MKKHFILKTFGMLAFCFSFAFGQANPHFFLIHGFQGNGSIWPGTSVYNTIQNEFHPLSITSPTLYWDQAIATQASTLNATLLSPQHSYKNDIVAIGYSMGGLTTREYFRQRYVQSQPQKIKTAITIGSPHQGALLMNNIDAAYQTVSSALVNTARALLGDGWLAIDPNTGEVQYWYDYDEWQAILAFLLIDGGKTTFVDPLKNKASATDLKVGSTFINTINATTAYESTRQRAGIYGVEDDRELWRIAARLENWNEETILDAVDYVQDYFLFQFLLALFDCAEGGGSQAFDRMNKWAALYIIVDEVPHRWRQLIGAEFQGNDGIVSQSAQQYPSAQFNLKAQGANHVEELNHSAVTGRLTEILNSFSIGSGVSPLSVSMSGPTIIYHPQKPNINQYTWTANVTGGTQPYTYVWKKNGYTVGSNSSTYTEYLSYDGNSCGSSQWTLRVDVTGGGSAYATKNVTEYHSCEEPPFAIRDGEETEAAIPEAFSLGQNYPNPFNPETEITFALPEPSTVRLTVLDVLGREVAVLANGDLSAGYKSFRWNGRNRYDEPVSSGMYFYRLTAVGESGKNFVETKKMLMTK